MWFRWVWLLKSPKDLDRQPSCDASLPLPRSPTGRWEQRPFLCITLSIEASVQGSRCQFAPGRVFAWVGPPGPVSTDRLELRTELPSLWFECCVFDLTVDLSEPLRFKVCSRAGGWRERKGPLKIWTEKSQVSNLPFRKGSASPAVLAVPWRGFWHSGRASFHRTGIT